MASVAETHAVDAHLVVPTYPDEESMTIRFAQGKVEHLSSRVVQGPNGYSCGDSNIRSEYEVVCENLQEVVPDQLTV
jgi:hypothetical protein